VSFFFFFSFSEALRESDGAKIQEFFFHSYVTLQENNYQLHSKNSALKLIAKGEYKYKWLFGIG